MTSGSSQGLFVIVAVVIFGIFVVISYLLFRDKLQTGLASIFDDSIETTTQNILYRGINLLPNSTTYSGWLYNSSVSPESLDGKDFGVNSTVMFADPAGRNITMGYYTKLNSILETSKFNNTDTEFEISIIAKGTGKIFIGIESITSDTILNVTRNYGRKSFTLTDEFTEYKFKVKFDSMDYFKVNQYFTVYAYTNTAVIYAYNPTLKVN